MSELVITQQNETGLAISTNTKELADTSEYREKPHIQCQRISREIEVWLDGQILNDALLAIDITEL